MSHRPLTRTRTFYLDEVSTMLAISPNYVRSLCRKYPDLFPERYYRRRGSHPRKCRVWTSHDVTLLYGLLLNPVKRKESRSS